MKKKRPLLRKINKHPENTPLQKKKKKVFKNNIHTRNVPKLEYTLPQFVRMGDNTVKLSLINFLLEHRDGDDGAYYLPLFKKGSGLSGVSASGKTFKNKLFF